MWNWENTKLQVKLSRNRPNQNQSISIWQIKFYCFIINEVKPNAFLSFSFIHWSVITAYATVGHMLKNTGALKSMLPICWSKDSLTLFLFTSFHTHFIIFCGGHWKKCPQISSLNILCRGASRMGEGQLGYGCLIYSPQLHILSSIHLRSSSTTPLSSIQGWTPQPCCRVICRLDVDVNRLPDYTEKLGVCRSTWGAQSLCWRTHGG